MSRNQKIDRRETKWYTAALISCFLPLVGIVLFIINTVKDFRSEKEKNKAVLYSAIGVLIFFILMSSHIIITSYFADIHSLDVLNIVRHLLWFFNSVYLFVVYFCISRRSKYLSGVLSLIQSDHITSVPQISEIIGLDKIKIVKYLKILINMGYLEEAIVDEEHGEIILGNSLWAKQRVICRSCGAEIFVNFGQTLVCEYCGGALSVQNSNTSEL